VDEVVVVMGLCVRQCEAEEGPKGMKLNVMARFQVHRVKQQWRVMGGGGSVVWMRWLWRHSLVFDNVREGEPKSETKSETEP
jgi:hypothetical protein